MISIEIDDARPSSIRRAVNVLVELGIEDYKPILKEVIEESLQIDPAHIVRMCVNSDLLLSIKHAYRACIVGTWLHIFCQHCPEGSDVEVEEGCVILLISLVDNLIKVSYLNEESREAIPCHQCAGLRAETLLRLASQTQGVTPKAAVSEILGELYRIGVRCYTSQSPLKEGDLEAVLFERLENSNKQEETDEQ